jgi:hypothetical protein
VQYQRERHGSLSGGGRRLSSSIHRRLLHFGQIPPVRFVIDDDKIERQKSQPLQGEMTRSAGQWKREALAFVSISVLMRLPSG